MHFLLRFPLLSGVILLLLLDLFVVRRPGWILENAPGIRFWVNYAFGWLFLFPLFWLIRAFFSERRGLRLAGLLIIFVPLYFQAFHFSVYDKFVTPFGVRFFFTDTAMTFGLAGDHLPWVKLLLVTAALPLFWKWLKREKAPVSLWRTVLAIFLVLASTGHAIFGWYGYPDFLNAQQALYASIAEAGLRRTGAFRVERPMPAARTLADTVRARAVVLVIGESTVKSHMSLYGYGRPTTPRLDSLAKAGRLLAFSNAVSVGNKTNLSVPYLLTGNEGPDPKGRFYRTPTLFDYAKSAGFTTALLSAQELRWGGLDRVIAGRSVDLLEQGSRFSPGVDVMKGADDMVLMNQGVLPFLDTVRSPFLLVIQMDGSHYPYSKHSPAAYKRFLPEETENGVNAYDNTLVYTDAVLGLLWDRLSSRFPGALLLFTPDHGQSVGGREAYNDNYTDEVIDNPLWIAGPADLLFALQANRDAPLSQIDIVPTLLDWWGIEPMSPPEGLSLLKPVPPGRLRLCSEYMPTFHNNPVATLIFPDRRQWRVDFNRNSVTSEGGGVTPYAGLPDSIKNYIDGRLGGP